MGTLVLKPVELYRVYLKSRAAFDVNIEERDASLERANGLLVAYNLGAHDRPLTASMVTQAPKLRTMAEVVAEVERCLGLTKTPAEELAALGGFAKRDGSGPLTAP